MLLKGVIDCPDLPLNVSRSALQNDGFVQKISDYITKKVADKLSGMCKTDRENYEKYWDDISPFIKYGYIKDEKFKGKMKEYILYKNLEGKYLTLKDYLEAAKEKHELSLIHILNLGDEDSAEVSDWLAQEYEICTRPGGHCAPLMHRRFGTEAQGIVRFSFSNFNTIDEVEAAISALRDY